MSKIIDEDTGIYCLELRSIFSEACFIAEHLTSVGLREDGYGEKRLLDAIKHGKKSLQSLRDIIINDVKRD